MIALLSRFQPSTDDLLRDLSQLVDEPMLRQIARADYGCDIDQHFFALRALQSEGRFDAPMQWHPLEVLELTRWSEPDRPDVAAEWCGARGHAMRAFACAALLRAAVASENEGLRQGWCETLIQLLDSLQSLARPSLDRSAAGFLAWLIWQYPDAEEISFHLVALFWLGLQLDAADDLLLGLAHLIAAQVKRDGESTGAAQDDHWLFGTTCFRQREAKWRSLGLAMAQWDVTHRSDDVRTWIGLIASMLADN